MRLIVLSGTSGAGKITATIYFTDIGYYTVDNLPPRLLPAFAKSCLEDRRDKVLVVLDARLGAGLKEVPDALAALDKQGTPAEVLFLDASDEILVRRFKETRRPHPVFTEGRGTILEAVQAERELLLEVRARAHRIIDSSNRTPAELCKALSGITGDQFRQRLIITVESFGFKYGVPIDADLVFDVRFLANPHYVPNLKPLTGLHPEVQSFVHADPITDPFLKRLFDFIEFTLPQYEREGKAYLTIAIGCTGGRHRSIMVAEELAETLKGGGFRVSVLHRDTDVSPFAKPTETPSLFEAV